MPLFGELLASLRFVRLARLLRLLRAGVIIGRAVQARLGRDPPICGATTVFIVVVAGAAQATVNAGEFESVWDSIWWAVVTVTTVGYGDLYPVTVQGRLIAMVVMVLGIGFLSVLTATVATQFIKTDTGSDEVMETLRRIEADMADVNASSTQQRRLRAVPTDHETLREYLAAIEQEIASGQARLAAARQGVLRRSGRRGTGGAGAVEEVQIVLASLAGWRDISRKRRPRGSQLSSIAAD